ncbi:MAG: hypothetical protein CM1200mP28_05000 [Deltaproteobacteria bacterium]|nr:MAG: hypothetical protein CM1200mP28_05000 [Deltaproteobacteria bacterium]
MAGKHYWELLFQTFYITGFKAEFEKLAASTNVGEYVEYVKIDIETSENPVPVWITVVHIFFMAWTVFNAHYPPFLLVDSCFF